MFSQACENLWRHLRSFRREAALGTWFYVLAWNAARNQLNEAHRKKVRRLATSEISRIAAQVKSTGVGRLHGPAERLRDGLSPEDRTLLILRVDRELPWADVARVMGVDEPALRKRFERVRKRLHERAAAEGLVREPR